MDAATEGAERGHFRFLKHDLLSYPIESMECLHKGQSAPGDGLLIHIWSNDKIPYHLFGAIEKENSVIWKGCITFEDVANC